MSTTLTAPETREFAKLESVIESGLSSFIATGNALAKIRDAELYRANHATFDAYCRDRWKIAKSRAYQLIAAATTVEAMSTVVDELPTNERQVRPLAKLPEAERAEAWQAAVEAEPSGPTAETVEAAVAERIAAALEEPLPTKVTTRRQCPKGGDHERSQDDAGAFCDKCLEPMDAEPVKAKPAKIKSTVVAQCQSLWDALTPTERVVAAQWFQDQLG